ncbi:MAG: hypothetical protein OEX81_03955 [Candidatus Pacebacteria bacterium]|nr:hypothetical protein [Candidatus Paceibacterota bacterium]
MPVRNKPNPQEIAQEYFANVPRPQPEEVIFEWKAASRPYKKRNKQYYTTIALIVFLVSLILFFAGQFLPIAVVVTLAFIAYVLSSVPPHDSLIKITSYGIRFDDQMYYWEELGRFWKDEKQDKDVINIELGRFPNRITLLYNKADEQTIIDVLSEVLLNEQPPLTSYEKASRWLAEKIPLE